ncbi:MAG TPA: hypothetical protein VIY10_23740 [Solirubrobacteraceae bacterium]|jgi:hypothetical protein
MSSPNPDNRRSSAEVEHLSRLEAIVRRGLDTDLEVGNALAEIRDTWLYRSTHETFEAYLVDRWGLSGPRGYQLIQAAEAAIAPRAGVDDPAAAARLQNLRAAAVRREGSDGLAIVWEQARQEFGDDDVTAVDIHLTVHRREEQPPSTPYGWPSPPDPAKLEAGALLRRLRWLMTESSGTIAYIAHQLESRAGELDEDACDQLREDVLVLDEDIAGLKAFLAATVDWDAEYGRLMAGEIAPFEDDLDEEDDTDADA